MASFQILGPVQVSFGERRLPVGGRRQLVLFSFLVVHANRAVSSDVLTNAVWGPARSGGNNRLQMAIARLRKALEPLNGNAEPRLQTVSGGYMLSIAAGELDADVFGSRVREGQAALDAGDPARASELLGQALGLWRGPPLAEVCFEDFAQAEIRQLEELRLIAMEARIDADLRLGRHTQLIAELDGLLAEQPTRERLAEMLMLALYRSGRQAEALSVYQRTRAHLAEQLGLEPGPALKALQAQILEQSPSLDASRDTADRRLDAVAGVGEGHNPSAAFATVPLAPTATIGREQELEAVAGLLGSPDSRLVTLTGPGGVGKTRLALELVRAVKSSFPDGVCWVELAGVAHPDDVGSTVARALAVTPLQGESTHDALLRYLATKRLLVVVDNFEHLLEAAGLMGELHSACPGLTVLVTSREPLDLGSEHRVVVSPLALPPAAEQATIAELESTAATALFIAAASRRDSRFAPTSVDAPAIARICARLDGLPLALELAAGRTGLLSVKELAARLDTALSSLSGGSRDVPARQKTLSATIDWSYQLLDQEQQTTLVQFAVFAGGATLDAAQAVTGATLETLQALTAKSLIDRHQQPDGVTRLVMLETVRRYALERLNHDPDQDTIRRRHLKQYLQLVEQTTPGFSTPDELLAVRLLDREIENITAALRWALRRASEDALRLAGQLGEYWRIVGDPDGLSRLDAALDAAGEHAPPQHRALAHLRRAQALDVRQQHELAVEAAEQAVVLYREAGDHAGTSRAYRQVACCDLLGDTQRSRASAEAACEHARLAGDDALLGTALAKLANFLPADERPDVYERSFQLLTDAGDYRGLASAYSNAAGEALLEDRLSEAMRLLSLALPTVERAQSPEATMFVSGNMGLAHLFCGDLELARDSFERELRLCLGHAFVYGADEGLAGLAAISAHEGQPEQAACLLGAARALGYPHAGDQPIYDRFENDFFAPARARYGTAAWDQAEQAGATLSYDQAIASALERSTQVADPQLGGSAVAAIRVESAATTGDKLPDGGAVGEKQTKAGVDTGGLESRC